MWVDGDIADLITSFVTNLTVRIVGTSVVNKPLNIGQSFNGYCFLEQCLIRTSTEREG